MAAEVKILIEGTTSVDSVAEAGEERTRPTISLIKDGELAIVVDPGVLESQQILIDALAKEGLTPDDINIVFVTHSHLDHYRNIGMFPKAKTLEFFGLWDKESVKEWPEQFSPNIQILRTPGHDYTSITFFVATKEGVVAICGDVFWKENYPEKPEDDLYALNHEELNESRGVVLKMADWVVPGHAGMFKVNKEALSESEPAKVSLNIKRQKFVYCRKCKKAMKNSKDSCICRPWFCYRCCECTLDCPTCSCSHKKK